MAQKKKSQKKSGSKRFAPIGLWVAAVATFATVSLLIFKLIIAANLYTLTNNRWLNLTLGISAGLIILGLSVFALLDPKRVRNTLAGRQARYGSNAAIVLIAFIGILIVLNVIVFQNPGSPLDLTEDKQNTIAPETLEALKALPSPVHATAFFTQNYSSGTAINLLDNYKANSSGKFTYEVVNPDQNPIFAQEAGISGDGKIYLQMGDRHEIVTYASEQELTVALIRLINPGERAVYFLTGHGEHEIEQSGETSYTNVKTALEAKNYTVKTLNLLAENKIPEDARAIIIAGPLEPVSINEMPLLEEYVFNGGSLVVMEEPLPLTQFANSPDPLADYLATTWGITFNNDIVIDTQSSQPLYAVAAAYGDHLITEKLQGLVSFYPTARSLSITADATTQPVHLVVTSNASWGETDFTALQNNQVGYDEGTDIPGPLALAMAVEDTTSGSRIVAIGDSDFASDNFYAQYANGDILINAIDWAAGQDAMINLTSPETITRSMKSLSSLTLILTLLGFIIILPGLVVAGGIASWLMRKARG